MIWNATEWRRGVSYIYNTIDLSLQKLDGGWIGDQPGRVLLQGNCIYQTNGFFSPINRFEIKTEKVYTIEVHKPHSYRIYEDNLYIEDYDNLYKVSPENWKPIMLCQKYASNNSSSVIAYFANGNEFVWIVGHVNREITIRILNMEMHKIVKTIKYTRKIKVGGAMKVKIQGDFIYTNQTFYDCMEFKKVNRKTGEVVDISKKVFEEAPDVLIEENIVIFGRTK